MKIVRMECWHQELILWLVSTSGAWPTQLRVLYPRQRHSSRRWPKWIEVNLQWQPLATPNRLHLQTMAKPISSLCSSRGITRISWTNSFLRMWCLSRAVFSRRETKAWIMEEAVQQCSFHKPRNWRWNQLVIDRLPTWDSLCSQVSKSTRETEASKTLTIKINRIAKICRTSLAQQHRQHSKSRSSI